MSFPLIATAEGLAHANVIPIASAAQSQLYEQTPIDEADLTLFKTICADFEDITCNDLHFHFSRILGIKYLDEVNATHNPRNANLSSQLSCRLNPQQPKPQLVMMDQNQHPHWVRGIVWGASLRLIISFPVQITESIPTLSGTRHPIHVHFLYLSASPQTYLSDEALRVMGIEDVVVLGQSHERSSTGSLRLPLKIGGYTLLVARSPTEAHFAHLNILGQDFVQQTGAHVFFGGDIPRFEISFP
ncbi:hypothetical protein BGW38_010415 [Lunasporangiospora selenospora]|uniref:Uncharacterized protein n=1 Tax=Lunasporangiospora selenospora TaxID=979761 RepID=A0A9P6FW94_9FUNG|nr:hypothetical protein BGW38_010415 [Lunasporangiospora selenospora]